MGLRPHIPLSLFCGKAGSVGRQWHIMRVSLTRKVYRLGDLRFWTKLPWNLGYRMWLLKGLFKIRANSVDQNENVAFDVIGNADIRPENFSEGSDESS